jgi:hypothetical protein
LKAVRKLAQEEWALKHRYAMVLHTDEPHPHVHVVLKARSEQGRRLNIRKATLRDWRQQFASNLRQLGVAANATERAVRGQAQASLSDGRYRTRQRLAERVIHRIDEPLSKDKTAQSAAIHFRREIKGAWEQVGALLLRLGHRELAQQVEGFLKSMKQGRTEQIFRHSRSPHKRLHVIDDQARTR